IITGGIDLSIGTGMTLTSVMTGVFIVYMGLPISLGILGGILTGALIGFIAGFSVSMLRIPPFIATLAMMMIAEGLSLVISGASPIYFSDVEGFNNIALGSIIPSISIPNAFLFFFFMVFICWFFLSNTIVVCYIFF